MFSSLIKLKKLSPTAIVPKYQSNCAAGFDLHANCPDGPIDLKPGGSVVVPLGFAAELPLFTQVSIRPRSGLAFKYNITVGNSPGTIDCDYRGEWKILLVSHGKFGLRIHHGDRIAQGLLEKVNIAEFVEVDTLVDTERGDGGFGSTGK
jgi:dUTP pyrophosphatase